MFVRNLPSTQKSGEYQCPEDPTGSLQHHAKPFSMVEDRHLLRGVKKLGQNWKSILALYEFARDRSAQQLRERWRTIANKRH